MKVLLQSLAISSSAVGVTFALARCHFVGCNILRGSNGLLKTNSRHPQYAFAAQTSTHCGFQRRSDRVGIVADIQTVTTTTVPVLGGLEKELVMLPEQHSLTTKFAELETILTREPFTDDAWLQSCENVVRIAISLASSVPPSSESPHLPAEHGAALSLVDRLTERCRRTKESASGWDYNRGEKEGEQGRGGGKRGDKGGGQEVGIPAGLHSSLKFCTKKNGLGKAAAEVAAGVLPRYECVRERAKAIRGVERCLSEFCMVWSTARLLESRAAPETKRDFLFHLKAVLEHTPACHRHEVVLVLCRGLFTPATNVIESTLRDHVHGAAFDPREGGYPLADAFAEVHEGASEHPRALRAARQAFPFLEILARWAWRCHLPSEPVSLSSRVQAEGVGVNVALEGVSKAASSGDYGSEGDQQQRAGASRGRGNTGVASLLVALARADPSGESIRSMQWWACEALVPEQVGEAPWSAIGTPVDRNEVARCLMCTRETFVIWKQAFHLRWMRSCREVGDILRLLMIALDEEGLEGSDLTSAVNHALFVTTFLRSMPNGAKARRGYESLIGSGRVPGERASFSAERGARERVTSWREAAEVLDLSMASILRVPEKRVRSEGFRSALSSLLGSWRAPHALADFYNMHVQQKREVIRKYLRFLRALLNASDETLHDIRFKDPANFEHMQHMPERVRRLWEAEPCTLAGTSDPEVIFRMGEDTRSCMGIRRACCKTNGALLGYLLQGNVRFVGVQSALARMEARAVLRLLLRADSLAPVLFMDEIYYSSHRDDALESQVVAEAKSVSDALGVPLYRAGDTIPGRPPEDSSTPPHDSGLRDGGLGCHALQESGVARDSKMCELIEVNGLSDFVYSDAPIGLLERAGMLQREPYPGQPNQRLLALAELAYAESCGELS